MTWRLHVRQLFFAGKPLATRSPSCTALIVLCRLSQLLYSSHEVRCCCLHLLESESLDEWQAELWVRMYLPASHLVMSGVWHSKACGRLQGCGVNQRGYSDALSSILSSLESALRAQALVDKRGWGNADLSALRSLCHATRQSCLVCASRSRPTHCPRSTCPSLREGGGGILDCFAAELSSSYVSLSISKSLFKPHQKSG